MIELIVIDIDGVLLDNGSLLLRSGNLSFWKRIRFFKAAVLDLFEFAERILKVNYRLNVKIWRLIKELKGINKNAALYLFTDRSLIGFFNVWKIVSALGLGKSDFIQIRKRRLVIVKNQVKKIRKDLGIQSTVFLSPSIKPNKRVFGSILKVVKKNNLKPKEVLIVDDNPSLIKEAATLGFATRSRY